MHWFWNSSAMDFIEKVLVNLTNFIWNKRRKSEKALIRKINNK